MQCKVSRRSCFKHLVGASVIGGMASMLPACKSAGGAGRRAVLKTGISTLGFRDYTNVELARELSGAGFKLIQLLLVQKDSNYWRFNGRNNDLGSLTAARARDIATIYRDAGLEIDSLGVYTNLIHPDPVEVEANLAYFEQMMEVGGHMGVRTLVTESGRYIDETKPATRTPLYYQENTWRQMVKAGQALAQLAGKHDVKVLVEPSYQTFFTNAKRVRVFVEEINSPRLRVLLDPANIFELNDLDEMFDQLAPWIDCIHAKDIKHHRGSGVEAGMGEIDYQRLVTLAWERTPHAPVLLEYVGRKNYRAAYEHLRNSMQACGIAEA